MQAQNLPRLLVTRKEASEGLQAQIEKGEQLCQQTISSQGGLSQAQDDFSNWSLYNKTLLTKIFSDTSVADSYYSLHNTAFMISTLDTFPKKLERYERKVKTHIKRLNGIRDQLELYDEPPSIPQHGTADKEVTEVSTGSFGDEVFIVHGRDEEAKEKVARYVEKLGIEATILHEQPNRGQTIIEKFETHAREAGYAIVLLTPDDIGASRDKANDLKPRARQNVILELGYFMGQLGRNRVCVLYRGNVELPSDIHGIVYVSMNNPSEWQLRLAQEMKQAELPIDLNKLVQDR